MTGLNYIDINNHRSFQAAALKKKQKRAEELIQRNKVIRKIKLNILQRVIGIFVVIAGIILCSCGITDIDGNGINDWTAAFIFVPLGLSCLLSKKVWLFK